MAWERHGRGMLCVNRPLWAAKSGQKLLFGGHSDGQCLWQALSCGTEKRRIVRRICCCFDCRYVQEKMRSDRDISEQANVKVKLSLSTA
jgi:hypothetical protein